MDKSLKIEVILLAIVLVVVLFFMLFLNDFSLTGFFADEKVNIPYNHIEEEDINATEDKIVINIKNPILTRYVNSQSMAPLLGGGAIGIEIVPISKEDVHLGDVVTFRKDSILIAHRVVEIGSDENGDYFITKGDNNNVDDGKVRFEQIKGIVVGVLY